MRRTFTRVIEAFDDLVGAGGTDDPVAEAEAELARLRAEVETARADVQRLGAEWLFAPSQAAAEEIARQRAEAERIIGRSELRIPEIAQRLAAARAERQRERLQHHHSIIRAFAPRLIAAVEAAAAVQVEAIALREAAVRELGEGVVVANIAHIAFSGLLLPDLVQIWASELKRAFDPPSAPWPIALPPPAKAAAPKPSAAPPAPRPRRAPRHDPLPESDAHSIIVFVKNNVELDDGTQAIIGDQCTMPVEIARRHVLSGQAEYLR